MIILLLGIFRVFYLSLCCYLFGIFLRWLVFLVLYFRGEDKKLSSLCPYRYLISCFKTDDLFFFIMNLLFGFVGLSTTMLIGSI